jgi:hypothetical protein
MWPHFMVRIVSIQPRVASRSNGLTVSKQPLHSCMTALDRLLRRFVEVLDTIQMRILTAIDHPG